MPPKDIDLAWAGPFSLSDQASCAAFAPPPRPGVYLWLTGHNPTYGVSYVGQTENLQKRFYGHFVNMLGGGYWLYDTEELNAQPKPEGRYTPGYATYFADFLAKWDSMAALAHQNLLSYTYTWAVFDSDKLLRESVESAIIHATRALGWAHQNPRTSRSGPASVAVRLSHRLPTGIGIVGLDSPTMFGELEQAAG